MRKAKKDTVELVLRAAEQDQPKTDNDLEAR